MEAVEIKVTGRVQGVGFRWFTVKAAQPLGLVGWVKNMPDGSVLTRAKGTPDALEQFRAALRKGPAFGRTDNLVETPLAPQDIPDTSFEVTY